MDGYSGWMGWMDIRIRSWMDDWSPSQITLISDPLLSSLILHHPFPLHPLPFFPFPVCLVVGSFWFWFLYRKSIPRWTRKPEPFQSISFPSPWISGLETFIIYYKPFPFPPNWIPFHSGVHPFQDSRIDWIGWTGSAHNLNNVIIIVTLLITRSPSPP